MTHKPFLYFGTPYVARDTLAYLVEHGYRPLAVVTSPDAPRGRGLTLTPSETKAYAETERIPVLTPERLTDEVIEELCAYGAAYAIVVAYGKILPEKLIESFPQGVLNIHYSLLPKYRGASPVEEALKQGDTVTGVSIQQMVYELDAGDVLAVRETPIAPSETARELRPRLVALGAELLVETLPSFESGTASRIPQDHAAATFSKKIRKEMGEIDLSGDAADAWNRYRAYAESPGTYTFLTKDGKRLRVKIRTAAFEDGSFVPLRVVPEGKSETDFASLLAQGWR
ncbi:MAG TPA: methionyl-tRNA formyltransferase [Candidatus Paceibacterota bacterium]|nr:methionyl-tRNA formyltransferase [Candidatus Paceibacterota bacterium]